MHTLSPPFLAESFFITERIGLYRPGDIRSRLYTLQGDAKRALKQKDARPWSNITLFFLELSSPGSNTIVKTQGMDKRAVGRKLKNGGKRRLQRKRLLSGTI